MFRKRQPVGQRGPGLASTMARTAVIAGTATAASGAVAGKQAKRHAAAAQQQAAAVQQQADREQLAALQEQLEAMQTQETLAQVTPHTGTGGDDVITQLARLGELHQNGLLTAEEFATAKAKLLGL